MTQSLPDVCVGVFFVAAMIWLILLESLARQLKLRHHDLYQQMGSPSLFGDVLPILRFIDKPDAKALNDPALIRQCQVMRVFLLAFLIGFIALICLTTALPR
ncbi:MAG: hypothetical protein GTO14_17545 [Anaerolineales bacterium]|nr:hypothetical protein [Anaerolineales bacterium]